MTLNINIQHNGIEYHYAECHDYINVMLTVVRMNVFILSVVAPFFANKTVVILIVRRFKNTYSDALSISS
jgi:hypothetical protein